MEGDFVEPGLSEAVLPMLGQLFGHEPTSADRAELEPVIAEFVPAVVRRTVGYAAVVDLSEEELSDVLKVVRGAVRLLVRWAPADLRNWDATHVRLAERLLDEIQRQGLSARQQQEARRLVTAVCRLVLDFVRTPDTSDIEFERRYREYVTAKYGSTRLFGAPSGVGPVTELAPTYVPPVVIRRASDFDAQPRSFEEVSLENPRLVLRGTAGAGKTTALQWLAVRAAADLGSQPYDQPALVPFFLPVRGLIREGLLPGPSGLLSTGGCPLSAPPAWARRVLAQGRGLLLVDGVDELPEAERAHVRHWVGELCAAYPLNRWVVSCRTKAVGESWLGDLHFVDVQLLPFSAADVRRAVRRWYRARYGSAVAAARAEALLSLLRERADLAEIATTPLMCAVLCAVHDERDGQLPGTRAALYAGLLEMMLGRRDAERGVALDVRGTLTQAVQVRLLGDLAYWMVRNWQNAVSYNRACLVIDDSRARLTQVPTPEEALAFLLNRSGVLRSLPDGDIDFVHRPFMDYLTAYSLVENGDFGLLAEHAHDDRWRDIFLCAVGLARPRERSMLLQLALERGDAAPERSDAVRIHLLVAAGLAEAPELEPRVAQAVRDRVAGHLPPRTATETAAFALLGATVLEVLPHPAQVPQDETDAFLELLERIPGPEAEALARRFAPPPRRPALLAIPAGLPEPPPGARRLAVALSVATRIEPELIRAVRLRVFPLLDAGDEADLWFSPWTAAQTPQAMALRTELLPALRAELAELLAASAPDDPLWQLGNVLEQVHVHISPALRVEERLNWLDVSGGLTVEDGSATVDALLLPALRALVEEHREGIADWLAGAWPRLPESVRASTAAWQLVTAAVYRVPDVALEHRPAPPGVTADDVAVIGDAVGDALLTVSRSGFSLTLGAERATSQDTAIVVPDTYPRVVEVLSDGAVPRTVTVPPGETRSVPVGGGPVRLRTPRGDVYEVGPAAGAEADGAGALDGAAEPGEPEPGALRQRHPRNGSFLLRTSAGALAATVSEVATDVWQAEVRKHPRTSADPSRLDELRGDFAALAAVLLDAGLEAVTVLLGELGGPADGPADVTLAGWDPATGEPAYVCVELRPWPVLGVDPDEPRLVRFGDHGNGVNPLERARARRAHLYDTNAPLRRRSRTVDVAAFLYNTTGRSTAGSDRLFLADDRALFTDWLRNRIAAGSGTDAADLLLAGAHVPLPGVLTALGNHESPLPFHPLRAQTLVVGLAMAAVSRREKRVLLVRGAAGTGKTAAAVRLFLEVRQLGATAVYVTGWTPFGESVGHAVDEVVRRETGRAGEPADGIPGGVTSGPSGRHEFDLLVFDCGQIGRSALNTWGTPWSPDRRIGELLDSADVCVFLLDEGATLRPEGEASADVILATAQERGLPVDVLTLDDPLRFGGSGVYPLWVSKLLAPEEDAAPWIPDDRHVVLTADGPEEMETFLKARQEEGSTVRLAAGACWTSAGAEGSGVRVGEWHRLWQKPTHPTARLDRIGTPQTVQGYEYDWCGVILGPDLLYRDGRWITVREANADPRLRAIPMSDESADPVIRNAYRVLLTRSRTGVVLFSTDPETQEALRRLVPGRVSDHR
ncbi:DUF2075 domain-containing protein [Streptomyces sp. NBC_00663]|uniref:DNA/RNA helicase domain-containing protein n=1 Tax=Streptomyces sp. NBC_00663 TaxID=2975801 RepID=UPI002E328C11|nr:DNA/RNA helicase domain-containing protein [Streptomyces sp. NBC_00663]